MTKDNATGLKEGGGNRNVNYSAFHIRDARSLRFEYSLVVVVPIVKNIC